MIVYRVYSDSNVIHATHVDSIHPEEGYVVLRGDIRARIMTPLRFYASSWEEARQWRADVLVGRLEEIKADLDFVVGSLVQLRAQKPPAQTEMELGETSTDDQSVETEES